MSLLYPVWGYAFVRPPTPNTTNAGLGLAPGATISVYFNGTVTLASIFSDQAGLNALGNPFVADVNGFYRFYTQPQRLDVAFAGGGIFAPYTLFDIVALDPRIDSILSGQTTLSGSLTSQIATLTAEILQIQQVGAPYFLGGSITTGLKNSIQIDVQDPIQVELPGAALSPYAGTVFATLQTDVNTTSVSAFLFDITANANVGNSVAVSAQVPTLVSFAVALTPGHVYKLQLVPSNNAAYVYGSGYLILAHP